MKARGDRHRHLGAARLRALPAIAIVIVACLSGCGLDVKSPDLFLLTRTGQGSRLTLLVNDAGTVRCNGAPAKPISGSALISARDLSDNLAKDASGKLDIPNGRGTVFAYRIRLELGTISFPDRAARGHRELAAVELFAAQTAQQVCGLRG